MNWRTETRWFIIFTISTLAAIAILAICAGCHAAVNLGSCEFDIGRAGRSTMR